MRLEFTRCGRSGQHFVHHAKSKAGPSLGGASVAGVGGGGVCHDFHALRVATLSLYLAGRGAGRPASSAGKIRPSRSHSLPPEIVVIGASLQQLNESIGDLDPEAFAKAEWQMLRG